MSEDDVRQPAKRIARRFAAVVRRHSVAMVLIVLLLAVGFTTWAWLNRDRTIRDVHAVDLTRQITAPIDVEGVYVPTEGFRVDGSDTSANVFVRYQHVPDNFEYPRWKEGERWRIRGLIRGVWRGVRHRENNVLVRVGGRGELVEPAPKVEPPAPNFDDALTIQLEIKDFTWTFTYPNGVVTTKPALPADGPLVIEATSADTLHSWYSRQWSDIGGTIGGNRKRRLKSIRRDVGTHRAVCLEYCGIRHSTCGADIEVLEADAFADWMKQQAAALSEKAD